MLLLLIAVSILASSTNALTAIHPPCDIHQTVQKAKTTPSSSHRYRRELWILK
jgi:hypothetical protein